MRIQAFSLRPYEISLTNAQIRSGALINIVDEKGDNGWGDIAPLPKWSHETLKDSIKQLNQKKHEIIQIDWTVENYLKKFEKLTLLPSVVFGLESALLSILAPLPAHSVRVSALLMGTSQDILQQAKMRQNEGFTSAKLKVGHLSFNEAASLIHQLKDIFHLRIDVNRAWTTADSLRFFSQFPLDAFDYVEEPFKNPYELSLFSHPLAVDESFPKELSLTQLESLPTLKALIYKPTIQGGMAGCLHLHEWTRRRSINLVLSSSFESDVGLVHVASIAHRLSLSSPVGIGTYHFLAEQLGTHILRFTHSEFNIPPSFLF